MVKPSKLFCGCMHLEAKQPASASNKNLPPPFHFTLKAYDHGPK